MTITQGLGPDLVAPDLGATAKQADALRTLRWLRNGAIFVPLLLTAIFGVVSWQSAHESARLRAEDNAVLVREYVQRLVQTENVALTAAEEALLRFRPERRYDREAHLFLRRLATRMESGLVIGFSNPDGRLTLSSEGHPSTTYLTSPAHHDYLHAGAAGTELFVDRIPVGPEGIDALVISRRPRGEKFDGVWVSAMSISVLSDFLGRIAGAPGDSASVLRGDGRLLVRQSPTDEPITLDPEQRVMQLIADGHDRAVYETVAQVDAVRRIYALERIGNLPLYAIFGVSRQAILWDWLASFGTVAGLLGLFSFAGYQLARYAARNVRAEAARAALAFDRKLLAEAEKTAALKDTMLRELNHRVKNSLQMIHSLIRLQRHREEGPDLDEISGRVLAIAAIHDLLYRSASSFDVDFAALIRAICENEAILPPGEGVTVSWRADSLELDVTQATPLALCTVELVTNAAKHAFGPEGGRIEVALDVAPDGNRATLTVADNGRGMPEAPVRSSGLRVVDALVQQLGATLELQREGGTRFVIAFPVQPGSVRS